MFDFQAAINDLARIKLKKHITTKDIATIDLHLSHLTKEYRAFKFDFEVLERRYDKQNPDYWFEVGDKVLFIPPMADGDPSHPDCKAGSVTTVVTFIDTKGENNQELRIEFEDGAVDFMNKEQFFKHKNLILCS